VAGSADLLCDLEKSHLPHLVQDIGDRDNECVDCSADYEGDMLHVHQMNWHLEDMVLDMVHVDEWDVEANVHDKHPEAEGMVGVVRNPMTPIHGGHTGNVEEDEEVEDGTLEVADASLAHALLEGERFEDDEKHFGPGYCSRPLYLSPCHSKRPQHFHRVLLLSFSIFLWSHHL
jgi:hypothetical protein